MTLIYIYISLLALSVCLSDQIFMKFYGMVGPNPATSRLDVSDLDPKVKVTRGEKVSDLGGDMRTTECHSNDLHFY